MQPDEKKCPLCGEIIKKSAIKCRFCGEFIDANQKPADSAQAPPQAAFSPQGQPKSAGPAEPKIYFQGNVSKMMLLGPYAYGLFAVILSVVLIFMLEGSKRRLGYYGSGFLMISWAVYFLAGYIKWKSRSFLVTSDRVESETGILSKSIVNLDMWRVRDIRFEQTIFQKMLGVGSVSFYMPDKPQDPLVIGPIKDARKLYELMKEVQVTADRRRGVVRIES